MLTSAEHEINHAHKCQNANNCGILTFISMIDMLINFKMPTIVGILTFISMINTTSESLKAR